MNVQAGDMEASRQSCWLGKHATGARGSVPRAGTALGHAGPAARRVCDTALGPGSVRPHGRDPARATGTTHPPLVCSDTRTENPGNIPAQSARSLQNQLWSWMVPSCCCLSPNFFPRLSKCTCKQEPADADHSWPC